MSEGTKLGGAYVDVEARLNKLEVGLKTAEARTNTAAKRMEDSFAKLRMNFSNSLMTQKLSEVQKIHEKLKFELQKKIALDVDIASLERTKIKIGETEKLLRG